MDREQRRILPGSLAERTERGHQPIRCLCGGKSGKSCLIRIKRNTALSGRRLSVRECEVNLPDTVFSGYWRRQYNP